MGQNLSVCVRLSKRTKENAKEHQLQESILNAWNKGKGCDKSFVELLQQPDSSV